MTVTSVDKLLTQQRDLRPDKRALIFQGEGYSYRTLDEQANRFAGWLREVVGLQKGDRVLVYGANSARLVVAMFAVWKAGGVMVPVHPTTSYAHLAFMIQDAEPCVLLVGDGGLATADLPHLTDAPRFFLGYDEPDSLSWQGTWQSLVAYVPAFPPTATSPEDLAAIIYTSGSTKEPRGVVSHHHHIVFSTSAINAVLKNRADDVILNGLPLSFDYGLYQLFLGFQVGATLVLEKDFSLPQRIPHLVAQHGVTGLPGVPSLFAMLLRSRLLERVALPTLRYLTSTGDVFPPAHIKRLALLLPQAQVIPMYGLTECKRVSIMPPGCLAGREVSAGLPLPGTSVQVVDEADEPLPPHTVGELVVRGPHVMAGYWRNMEETQKRFRRDPVTNEWLLYTGDKFKLDEEGFLYFVGRDESVIKSRGYRIGTADIEAFLCTLSGVAEAAAVGVPDEILGQAIHLFVSTSAHGIDEATLRMACEQHLSPHAQPHAVHLTSTSLPKTVNGKTDRIRLKQSVTVA